MAHPLTLPQRVGRIVARSAVAVGIYSWIGYRYLNVGVRKLVGASSTDVVPHPNTIAPIPCPPITDQDLQPLNHFQYDPTTGDWVVVSADTTLRHNPVYENRFRVVSYNVLSSPALNMWTCELARWDYILDVELPNSNADVFMLNEVSETFWRMAMQRPWIRDQYYVTDYHFNNGPRNNMIISRVPMQNLQMETVNDRRSFLTKIEPKPDSPLWLCASHLHAKFYGHLIRRAQLDAMYDYIERTCGSDPVLIMGDLNFHDESENINILPPFYDVYRSLNPLPEDPNTPLNEAQLGITFDSPGNAMVAPMAPAFGLRMRLDRALLRPSTNTSGETFVPSAMDIFAKQPISPLTPSLLPSDHYALSLDFDIQPLN